MERNWLHTSYRKRTPWRWIRDLFDNTAYVRRGHQITKQNEKKYARKIKAQDIAQLLPAKEKSIETMPAVQSAVIIPEIVTTPPPATNSYVESKNINDYAACSTQSVEVIAVPTPYFIPIPIKTVKFKVVRTKKIIPIKIPKIKYSLVALKRFALATMIFTLISMSLATSILFYRGIKFMDGDYVGETYRMKMAEFDKETMVRFESRVSQIETDMNNFRAQKELGEFIKLSHWTPPKPKVIIINKYYKNRKAPVTQTISK